MPFPDNRVLDCREVPVFQPWGSQHISSNIAEAHCQFGTRETECTDVPELIYIWICGERGDTCSIGNVRDFAAAVCVADGPQTDRGAVGKRQYAADLPAAGNPADDGGTTAQ